MNYCVQKVADANAHALRKKLEGVLKQLQDERARNEGATSVTVKVWLERMRCCMCRDLSMCAGPPASHQCCAVHSMPGAAQAQ
jgi:hypothetical protein